MFQTFSRREKLFQLLRIFFPILLSQGCLYATTFFNTIMAGQASPEDLAGVSIGNSLWIPFQTGLTGILIAITPIVSQKVGSRAEKEDIRKFVFQSLYIACLLAITCVLVVQFATGAILETRNLAPEVRTIAHHYLKWLSIGFLPLFLYTCIRSFFDALGKTRVSMLISFLMLPINILLNYLLIYGNWGFPKMGGVGSGIATTVTDWIIICIAIAIATKMEPFSHYRLFKQWLAPSLASWKQLFKTGVPIGLAIFSEVSIFAVFTLLMGDFSTHTIAAHQSALNFASSIYTIPLSTSMALTIVVGFEVGAERIKDAIQYVKLGLAMTVGFASLSSLLLFFFRENIAGLYSNKPDVIHLTAQFLIYAIFFQFSDAIQAPIQGSLRGFRDVKVALYMTIIGYWLVGLPVGYLCGNYTNLGAFGYWIGLISGLFVCAIGVFSRLLYIQKKAKEPHQSS